MDRPFALIASTGGTVVKSTVGGHQGRKSLSHDGPDLMVQWLVEQIQDLPIGTRVRVTLEQLPNMIDPEKET